MEIVRVDDPPGRAANRSSLADKRRAENFPVAARVLPRRLRVDLVTVYDVARTIDDLGDEAAGERSRLLEEFGVQLAGIWQGRPPRRPVLRRLATTVAAHDLDQEPFQCLVMANLVDQRTRRYLSYEQLRAYCALSAEPIGRIVLQLFGVSSAFAVTLSDRICAALQLVEHCQDVGEDRRAGRVYLPGLELERFGVPDSALDATTTSPALRRLLAFQLDRASALLDSGAPLLGMLDGWARLAVAGYLAGGRAAMDAVRRIDYDVLARAARPRRRDVTRHLVRALAHRSTGAR